MKKIALVFAIFCLLLAGCASTKDFGYYPKENEPDLQSAMITINHYIKVEKIDTK